MTTDPDAPPDHDHAGRGAAPRAVASVDPYIDPRMLDPGHLVLDTSSLEEREVDQVLRVLDALRRWREADDAALDASRRAMGLGPSDMRALRYLVVLHGRGELASPSGVAAHLGISTASTTKLLDRLESAGHIERRPHPTDRRAIAITLSSDTHRRVLESVGRRHARRFELARKLTPAEREIVIHFLDELSRG